VAFTNAERVKIRIDLGWPGTSNWDSSLESAIDAAGADADITTEVQTVLARIDTIETEIAGLHGIALAEKVEESTLNPRRYSDLRTAGRREVKKLSAMLNNAEIRRDIFATGWAGGFMRMG
jgi:hypothetical protein